MVHYILAAFFTALGIFTVSSNLETSELVVGLVFITMAALLMAAKSQSDVHAREIAKCKNNHPAFKNNWPTETAVYDWSKDQEGTE